MGDRDIIADVLRLAIGLLLIARLYAQDVSEPERKFVAHIDDALGVHSGVVIADIGTGPTITQPERIAGKVGPNGRVICVDIDPSVVGKIKGAIEAHGVRNVEASLGTDNDPNLEPREFDAILVSNAYHEFTRPLEMLKHVYEALKPNGRLVIAEFYAPARRGESREAQTKRHDLSPDLLEQESSKSHSLVSRDRGTWSELSGRINTQWPSP